MHERRQMRQHALQPHVLRKRRRLHLAAHVKLRRPARVERRHRHARVHPFADIADLDLPDPRHHVPAVRDEKPWDRGRHHVRRDRQRAG